MGSRLAEQAGVTAQHPAPAALAVAMMVSAEAGPVAQ